ncbi:hypothetical protein HF086_003285 [Spodoptera exigua]|uniref:Intimal thickness related receptor IRP domain-containing protein n=1 Tax=Spodoptera exigua TaxID=7107 RepID=A0A922SGQ9_SPOEX|nr:hypothetical protein HF086_003285 [Spodoptera exigua]
MLFLFLLILISNSLAELFLFKSLAEDNNNVATDTQYKVRDLYKYNDRGEPLWVLSLSGNDWMNPTLRLGSSKEMEDFFQYIGPLMRINRGRSSSRVKKNDPNKTGSNEDSLQAPLQKDFMKMINKFVISNKLAMRNMTLHESNNEQRSKSKDKSKKMPFDSFENVGSFVRDCNGSRLRFDQACLQLITNEDVSFWSQYEECEGCVLLGTANISATHSLVLGTGSPLNYEVRNGNGLICNGTYQFGEYGQYILNITDVKTDTCLPRMTAEPDAAYLPILTAVVILLSMATLWYVVKGVGKRIVAGRLYARYFASKSDSLLSLSIFVNAGGGGYGVFSHSVWNGLTVADVVFPWFAFAMGEALVATRSLMLSLIGIVLGSSNSSWIDVRLPGVLQRLAAMYLIVGALECAFMRTSQDITPGRSLFRDISAGWQQWLATLVLVSIQRGSFRKIYHTTVPHDPEGILGILSGVFVVQAGAHATRIMLAYNHAR